MNINQTISAFFDQAVAAGLRYEHALDVLDATVAFDDGEVEQAAQQVRDMFDSMGMDFEDRRIFIDAVGLCHVVDFEREARVEL